MRCTKTLSILISAKDTILYYMLGLYDKFNRKCCFHEKPTITPDRIDLRSYCDFVTEIYEWHPSIHIFLHCHTVMSCCLLLAWNAAQIINVVRQQQW